MHELLSIINCLNVGGAIPALRKATRLNNNQKSVLERTFTADSYPNQASLEELALQTCLNKGKVSQWFITRRMAAKKQKGGARLSLLKK